MTQRKREPNQIENKSRKNAFGRTFGCPGKRAAVSVGVLVISGMLSPSLRAGLSVEAIQEAAGTEATKKAEGVVRIGWVRDNVPVNVDGTRFPPTAGLGSWAAFKPIGKHEEEEGNEHHEHGKAHEEDGEHEEEEHDQHAESGAIVMGDTVVFRDEVDAAMDAAFANGLKVTALHNHFFYDKPKAYFMHIGGRGKATELAKGVKAMWDAIKDVREKRPKPAEGFDGPTPKGGKLDAERIEEITGLEASKKPGGVVKVSQGREGYVDDVEIGGSMGLGTWAAFSGSDQAASIDGDFIMAKGEVQPVLRALRKHDIHIVALHNHMIGEKPPFYFTHYWATGSAANMAKGFKAAVEAQAEAREKEDKEGEHEEKHEEHEPDEGEEHEKGDRQLEEEAEQE